MFIDLTYCHFESELNFFILIGIILCLDL